MSTDLIEVKAGEYLIREADESAQMYYLQSGSMAVFKVTDGAETQIGTIYSGELVGEMSFLDKEPRSASVKAISDSKLLVIPVDKFEKYFSDQPSWYKALIHTLLERLRKANARIRI